MAGEHIVNYMRWVCHWRGLGNHMDPGEDLPETKSKLDLLNYDFLHKRNLLFGTPDYVVNKIKLYLLFLMLVLRLFLILVTNSSKNVLKIILLRI